MSSKLYVFLVFLTGSIVTLVEEIFKLIDVPWLPLGIAIAGAVGTCVTTILAAVKEYQNSKAK